MPSKPERILYLEDMPDIAEVTMMALETFGGHEVKHFATAEAALEDHVFRPDLLLLDVMTPGMSGPELLVELRRRPEMADVPAVFLTAKAQVHEQEEYLALGAAAVVTKPFEPLELSDRLTEIWRKARTADEAKDEPDPPPRAT